jgi:hypothetical protein
MDYSGITAVSVLLIKKAYALIIAGIETTFLISSTIQTLYDNRG